MLSASDWPLKLAQPTVLMGLHGCWSLLFLVLWLLPVLPLLSDSHSPSQWGSGGRPPLPSVTLVTMETLLLLAITLPISLLSGQWPLLCVCAGNCLKCLWDNSRPRLITVDLCLWSYSTQIWIVKSITAGPTLLRAALWTSINSTHSHTDTQLRTHAFTGTQRESSQRALLRRWEGPRLCCKQTRKTKARGGWPSCRQDLWRSFVNVWQ